MQARRFVWFCGLTHLALVLASLPIIKVQANFVLAAIASFIFSTLPLLFWNERGRKPGRAAAPPNFTLLLGIVCIAFLVMTFLKFSTRGYEISLSPVDMRDQLLTYSRSFTDRIIGVLNNLVFAAVLGFLMVARYYRIELSRKAVVLFVLAFAVYFWSAGSRLSMVYGLAILFATGWRLRINLRLVALGALIVFLGVYVFLLRAERSALSIEVMFLNYANWLQVGHITHFNPGDNDIVGALYLSILYISHSFHTLTNIASDSLNHITSSMGGVIGLFVNLLGFDFSIASPYRGLMHTELGYFLNEIGWIGTLTVLVFKCLLAAMPSYNISIFYLKLTVPLAAVCAPLTSAYNFAMFIPFVGAIILISLVPRIFVSRALTRQSSVPAT